jgi:hypothetical protein
MTNAALQARVDDLEHRLFRIAQWCDAYPLDIFPEPDFELVAQVLSDHGHSLGAVSAANMRHVLRGVAEICRLGNGSGVHAA